MEFPSSPPLLAVRAPSSSPPPLPNSAVDLPTRPSGASATFDATPRKRQFSDYGSGLSSDPVFSEGSTEAEDDLGAERSRRKRLVRGPWWNLASGASPGLRRRVAERTSMRAMDSGVWLGSDSSDEGADGTRVSRRKMAEMGVQHPPAAGVGSSPWRPSHPSPAAALAARAIAQCVDQGRETVDLSDLGLDSISDATLRPLHQLIRPSNTHHTRPPSEDEFTTLTPEIKLFLSGNQLSSLPSELFHLHAITVLSLRNNTLHSIPRRIGRLSNLKELNIAQNNIRSLPWEMLDLMHSRAEPRQINVRPNPLLAPCDLHGPSPLPRPRFANGDDDPEEAISRWGETSGAVFAKMKEWYREEGVEWTLRHELELRLKFGRLKHNMYTQEASRAGMEPPVGNREQLVYLASSTVRFFEVNGSACRSHRGTSTTTTTTTDPNPSPFPAVTDPLTDAPPPTTPPPSLLELSLRTLQSHYTLDPAPPSLPTSLTPAFAQAAAAAEAGENEACATCGRRFVLARAEWVEYWFCGFPALEGLTPESVLPFVRRVCTWACARPSALGDIRR